MKSKKMGRLNKESKIFWVLFILLWSYIIARAIFVFLVHDEIVTMWLYMIDWNPLPYHGYIDANNHFLNSFLGGLFIRIFHSDALFIVRLASVLSFPVYFWSIYALRKYFEHRTAFYGFFISLLFAPFLIEYFGLARGYGMSLGFLLLAFVQMMKYFGEPKPKSLVFLFIAWLLAVFSNLTLLPFALLVVAYILLFQIVRKQYKWIGVPILALAPLLYLLKYSFHLKEIGKLYYGEATNFIEVTIHSLTRYLWHVENYFLDGVIIILFIVISITAIIKLIRSRNLFDPTNVFSLSLIVSVVSVFAQNWLLGVNFPEDRTGLYLIVFFFGGLFFTLDYWKTPWAAYPIMLCTGLFFFANINLTHSIFWKHEHFDKELITKIPDEVMGIPPSTSGRWTMENELSRRMRLPMRIFQNADLESDTLSDYILSTLDRRPDLSKNYHILHKDTISNQTLFERNVFLSRVKSSEQKIHFSGSNEFLGVYTSEFKHPVFIVCEGTIAGLGVFSDAGLVFSSEDTISHQNYAYESMCFQQNSQIENGKAAFKVTYAMSKEDKANSIGVYVLNKNLQDLKGEMTIEIYEIDPDLN